MEYLMQTKVRTSSLNFGVVTNVILAETTPRSTYVPETREPRIYAQGSPRRRNTHVVFKDAKVRLYFFRSAISC